MTAVSSEFSGAGLGRITNSQPHKATLPCEKAQSETVPKSLWAAVVLDCK